MDLTTDLEHFLAYMHGSRYSQSQMADIATPQARSPPLSGQFSVLTLDVGHDISGPTECASHNQWKNAPCSVPVTKAFRGDFQIEEQLQLQHIPVIRMKVSHERPLISRVLIMITQPLAPLVILHNAHNKVDSAGKG